MATLEDRFNVKLTMDIKKVGTDGSLEPFDLTEKTAFSCPRVVMHSIESAIGLALIELGDQGIVLLGGDEGAAALDAQKTSREKVRGSKK